jgi:two-component sensor histidine kinase
MIASVTTLDPPFPVPCGWVGRRENAHRALTTRTPVALVDAGVDEGLRQINWPIGSALYVPLVGRSGGIGVIAMYRRQAGEFPPQHVKLAELFAARAAVAVENSRLLDQTRADAQTKAILLRELNHRVKNNLAGIVGLLSTSPRDLPDDSRRWLDRVIDRIETMARVHELFVGGATTVRLPELIRNAVETIETIRPPGVTIRTRAEQPDNVVIEVIDDGGVGAGVAAGNATPQAAVMSRTKKTTHEPGIGLSLVRGLVSRELHGEFDLRTRPEGGTVATIRLSGAERNGA